MDTACVTCLLWQWDCEIHILAALLDAERQRSADRMRGCRHVKRPPEWAELWALQALLQPEGGLAKPSAVGQSEWRKRFKFLPNLGDRAVGFLIGPLAPAVSGAAIRAGGSS